MPIYDYRCDHCGHAFSAIQSFKEEARKVCPNCGLRPRRLIVPPALVFKGSGWYVTDSRKARGGEDGGDKSEKADKGDRGDKADTGDKADKGDKRDKGGDAAAARTGDGGDRSNAGKAKAGTAPPPKREGASSKSEPES